VTVKGSHYGKEKPFTWNRLHEPKTKTKTPRRVKDVSSSLLFVRVPRCVR
jgi:hypothetical protein